MLSSCFCFLSCNSDHYNTGADEVADSVKEGTWRVSYFSDSGSDKTANFEGYFFVFSNNSALIATRESISHNGIWSVAASTNDADIHSTVFKIAFGASDIFGDLTGDWKVVENSGSILKLRDDSEGDTAVDYLNFEKN